VGRAGYGTRNQIRRPPAPGLSTWDAFRFPLHEPGADLRHKEIPYSVQGWTADTWADAQRLEAAIASGASTPPQSVSAGVILRCLPPRRFYTVDRLVLREDGAFIFNARVVDYVLAWAFVSGFFKLAARVAGSKAQASTMSSRRGSFAELVALAERAGQSEALPALALAGVRNIAELAANTDRLVEAGISPVTLEALLAAPLPVEATSDLAVATAGPSRPDLPVRRDATRASLAAAVEAVRPANVKLAVTELRDNMLAKSTRGPYESRLRTWNRLAFEGKVPAWPITARTLE
ncbi:Ranbp1, partial [Symbiodinium sp. KB8]